MGVDSWSSEERIIERYSCRRLVQTIKYCSHLSGGTQALYTACIGKYSTLLGGLSRSVIRTTSNYPRSKYYCVISLNPLKQPLVFRERSRQRISVQLVIMDSPISLALGSFGNGTTNLPFSVWKWFDSKRYTTIERDKRFMGDSSISQNLQRTSPPDATGVWNVSMWRFTWAKEVVDPALPLSNQPNPVSKVNGLSVSHGMACQQMSKQHIYATKLAKTRVS